MALKVKLFARIPTVLSSLCILLGFFDGATGFLEGNAPVMSASEDFLLNRLSVKANSLPDEKAKDNIPITKELVGYDIATSLDDHFYRSYLSMARCALSPTTEDLQGPKPKPKDRAWSKWWDAQQMLWKTRGTKILENLSLNNDFTFRGLSKTMIVEVPDGCGWPHKGFNFFLDYDTRKKEKRLKISCGIPEEMATLRAAMEKLSPQDAHKMFKVGRLF